MILVVLRVYSHMYARDRVEAIGLMMGFVILGGYSILLGVRVFRFANRIQQLARGAEREGMSEVGAMLARTFLFAVGSLACCGMAILIILARQ